MTYPTHLKKLVYNLRKLPGVGTKSAERFAFEILNWTPSQQKEMAYTLETLQKEIRFCPDCGAISDLDSCLYCTETRKANHMICLVAYARDIFSIDETGEFRGLYHVLNGLLSPIEGIGPEQLSAKKLIERIEQNQIKEVVIALDSTLEGDTTALYIKDLLSNTSVVTSRLAFGIPMGSSLDYVDQGTLARAFCARSPF